MLSIYEENIDQTLDISVPLLGYNNKEEIFSTLKKISKIIVEKEWKDIDDEDINVSILTGGITNNLYLLSLKENINKSQITHLIARVYGLGTEEFIDRQLENKIFASFSKAKISPKFFGQFKNGRIEGFIRGRNPDVPELKNKEIYSNVAKTLSYFHNLPLYDFLLEEKNVPETELELEKHIIIKLLPSNFSTKQDKFINFLHDSWLYSTIKKFLTLAKDSHFLRPDSSEFIGSSFGDLLERLISVFLKLFLLQENNGELPEDSSFLQNNSLTDKQNFQANFSKRKNGRLFLLDKVLSHNDLLSGNLILTGDEEDKNSPANIIGSRIIFIDYEYTSVNFRGFDFGNHFCEFAGFDFDIVKDFPTESTRLDFINDYLSASPATQDKDEHFKSGVDDVALLFCLTSNLFWGYWGLVQASTSSLDFDYLSYAHRRLAGFDYQSDLYGLGGLNLTIRSNSGNSSTSPAKL